MPCSFGTKATFTVEVPPEAAAPGSAAWFFLVHPAAVSDSVSAIATTTVLVMRDRTSSPWGSAVSGLGDEASYWRGADQSSGAEPPLTSASRGRIRRRSGRESLPRLGRLVRA